MFSTPLTPAYAMETDPERVARHLAMLRELAEIGMHLARSAGRDALREAEEANAAVGPAERRPRREARSAFARLAHGVRQAIAMERRVIAGALEPEPRTQDQRKSLIWAPLRDLAEAHFGMDGFDVRRDAIAERLAEALDADPDRTQPPGEVLVALAGRLGIRVDAKRLPETLRVQTTGPP